jgi:hypothetical protein
MKQMKMLGLVVVVALALTSYVGVGTAGATALYSGATKLGAGTELEGTLTATLTVTTTDGTTLVTCTAGGLSATTSNGGGAAETVKATVAASGISFGNCTTLVKTLQGGAIEFHSTSGLNGTVTASGIEFTINTTLFGSCVFAFGTGTTLGTFTGSTTGSGVFDFNAIVTRVSGLCPASAKMVTTYKTTKPSPVHITAS